MEKEEISLLIKLMLNQTIFNNFSFNIFLRVFSNTQAFIVQKKKLLNRYISSDITNRFDIIHTAI